MQRPHEEKCLHNDAENLVFSNCQSCHFRVLQLLLMKSNSLKNLSRCLSYNFTNSFQKSFKKQKPKRARVNWRLPENNQCARAAERTSRARSAKSLTAGVQGPLKGPGSSGVLDALCCNLSLILGAFYPTNLSVLYKKLAKLDISKY